MNARLRRFVVALLGTVAFCASLPLRRCRPTTSSLVIPFFGYAIALLGFNLLFGYTGLLSFGHAMFLGFGAYGAAVMSGVLGVKIVRARAAGGRRRFSGDRACRSGSCACATSASSSAC